MFYGNSDAQEEIGNEAADGSPIKKDTYLSATVHDLVNASLIFTDMEKNVLYRALTLKENNLNLKKAEQFMRSHHIQVSHFGSDLK